MIFALLILVIFAFVIGLMAQLFRFTDHDDNLDDEGGWK